MSVCHVGGPTLQHVFASDVQKKTAAASAAEYKKTDEAQPDVKEEEEEEEAEEEESSSPGWYEVWLRLLCGLPILTDVFMAAAEEKNEDESPAEKEEDQEGAADEVS